MKQTLFVFTILFLAGCAHTRYYAPVLMEKTQIEDQYKAVYSSGIALKRSTEKAKLFANISITSIHPGFLHRSKERDHWSKREKANAWKDKDMWVFIQVEGLDGNDIFETKVDRKAVFSHVVMNTASFDSLAVDIQPIPVELNKVFRVKAKIYTIDKFLIRKAIIEAKDKSIGKWALDTVEGLGKSIGNVFAKEAFDYYKTVTDQNYTFEQFLLTAGSNLEFSGSFDLVPSDTEQTTEKEIALYDFIKSERDPEWKQVSSLDFTYLPTGIADYTKTYKTIKGTTTNLVDAIDSTTTDGDLKKSFIKFAIKTTTNAAEVKSF